MGCRYEHRDVSRLFDSKYEAPSFLEPENLSCRVVKKTVSLVLKVITIYAPILPSLWVFSSSLRWGTNCRKGCSGWGGGLAEYIAVDTRYIHRLKEGIPCQCFLLLTDSNWSNELPVEVGACIEPLSIAYHSVKRSNFKPGQSVLIAGAGPVSTRWNITDFSAKQPP